MRRKKSKNKLVIFLICLIVVAGISYCVFLLVNKNNKKPESEQPKNNTTNIVAEPEKEPEEGKKEDDGKVNDKEPVIQYEGENPNKSEELTGVMTYLGKTSTNIIARVNIDQYLSEGTCEIKFIKNGTVYYQQKANLIADVSTSTCEGFTIGLGLIEPGSYNVVIELNSGAKTGTIEGKIDL